jgi:surface protein
MENMFDQAYSFNQPLEQWNVTNVLTMRCMFMGALRFNQPLEKWDVRNVRNMSHMFCHARAFNQPLGEWGEQLLPELLQFDSMFYLAVNFKQPLTKWYQQENTFIANNESIRKAIYTWFDQRLVALCRYGPISTWNTSAVTDMSYLFCNKTDFNEDITHWDTSNVTDMSYMFYEARRFNQAIGTHWQIDQVLNMEKMFYEARSFNQPLLLEQWKNLDHVKQKSDIFNQPSIQSYGPNLEKKQVSIVTTKDEEEKKKFVRSWSREGVLLISALFVGLLAYIVFYFFGEMSSR